MTMILRANDNQMKLTYQFQVTCFTTMLLAVILMSLSIRPAPPSTVEHHPTSLCSTYQVQIYTLNKLCRLHEAKLPIFSQFLIETDQIAFVWQRLNLCKNLANISMKIVWFAFLYNPVKFGRSFRQRFISNVLVLAMGMDDRYMYV